MNFIKCFLYLIVISVLAFIVGRILPKKWFCADHFPYKPFKFEQDGRVYNKLKVHIWQNKVPDMSKILPQIMPPKNLGGDYKGRLPLMLQETCIAEFIHILNCFTGLYCIKLLPGISGVIIAIMYIFVFNLPFIIIQRYNRPRLQRLLNRLKKD